MTKNLNSFLLAICTLFCLSTANAQSFPDTAWTRCYGGSLIDEGLYIQQTFDGGYIVLGRSSSVDGDLLNAPAGNKNWILKLDSLGNIEWQQYLNVNQFTDVKNIQQTIDGGYLVGGQKLTKLLPDGNIDWEFAMQCQSAIETYDGGYALLFDQNKITKLTPNLIQEWTNDYFYGIIETSYYGLSELVQTTDSGYAFCGRWSGFPRPYVHGGWLRKVDKNGSHVLSKEWGDYSYVGFTESMDGEFVVTGSLEDVPGSGYLNQGIAKCDSTTAWKKDMTNYTCSDVMERYDETLLVCGRSGLPISQSSLWGAFLSKRTGTGDSILTKIFGGDDEDAFSTIIPTTDSGYIAIGYTRSNNGDVWGNHGGADVWIVKFKKDTSTYVPTSISPEVSRSTMNEIKVYPTLTQGAVQVNFPEGHDDAVIEVYNITGQRVQVNISGGGSKRVVALDDQPGGQYIFQVRNGGERKVFRVTVMP